MKSRANIKGHPVHQILVPFPIAFFTGAFISDLIFFIYHQEILLLFSIYLEAGGILFSVLAAIPGIIDFTYTVPRKSSAKVRAMQHGLLNASMMFLFGLALLLKIGGRTSILLILALEGSGFILLSIAGWLGGTLSTRNQIGVDHRYADAGRWSETSINTKDDVIELKNLNELKTGQMKLIHINKLRIAIGKTERGFVAFEDRCSHKGGSLADGVLICETVQCPWHGSQFDVNTGSLKAGPAKNNISIFKLSELDQKFFLHIK